MEVKLYGSTKDLERQLYGSTYTSYINLANNKLKEFQTLIDDIARRKANFFDWSGDMIGNLVGGGINAVADLFLAGELRRKMFFSELERTGYDPTKIGDVLITVLANDAFRTLEGVGSFIIGGVDFLEQLRLGATRDILTAAGQFFNDRSLTLMASQVEFERFQSETQDQKDAENYRNFFDNLVSETYKGKLWEGVIGQNEGFFRPISSEEAEADRGYIARQQGGLFYGEVQRITNASSQRREFINNLFSNQAVTDEINSGSELGKLFSFSRGISQSLGRIGIAIAIGGIGGALIKGAGLTGAAAAQAMNSVKLASSLYFGGSIFGQAMEEAIQNGASLDDALTYALGLAITETAIENVSGFVLGESLNVDSLRTVIQNSLNEGIEEAVAEIGSGGLSRYSSPIFTSQFRGEKPADAFSRVFVSAASGAISGALLSTGSFINARFTKKGQIQSVETALRQDIEEVGVETFTKDAKPRIERALKILNNPKTTEAQRNKILEENPFLASILEKDTKYIKIGVDDKGVPINQADSRFTLNTLGQAIVQGRVVASQGNVEITKETHAVSKTDYLKPYKNKVEMATIKADGTVSGKVNVPITILTQQEVDALPQKTQQEVKELLNEFKKMTLGGEYTLAFVKVAMLPTADAIQNFKANVDYANKVIYVNANLAKENFKGVIAHEMFDVLDTMFKQGKLTPKANKTWKKFKALFERDGGKTFQNLIREINKQQKEQKGEEVYFFDEQAYRNQFKNKKNEQEMRSEIERERISAFIEQVLVSEDALKAVIKSRNPDIINFFTEMGKDANINAFLKTFMTGKGKVLENEYLNAIQNLFTKAFVDAKLSMETDNTLASAIPGLIGGNYMFSLSSDEEKKPQISAKDLFTKLTENTEEGRAVLTDLLMQSTISSFKNFQGATQIYNEYSSETFQEEKQKIANKFLENYGITLVEPNSELGKQGYLMKVGVGFNKNVEATKEMANRFDAGALYFRASDFLDFASSPNINYVKELSFDYENNLFRVSFDGEKVGNARVFVEHTIFGGFVGENNSFLYAPMSISTAMSEESLRFFLEHGTVPNKSFGVNYVGVSNSPLRIFNNLIRDNGNEFYVSFHAKPSILSKRDTLALKTDGFTATNRLTLANGKNFVLWFNQSNEGISVDASIRAKVDVLRKVLEGAKKKAIVDMTKQGYESSILVEDALKNFSTDYLRKLNLTTLNINNPNKTAEDIRNEMDAVRATFKNEDVVAIYSSALTSLQNLVREGVNLEQIGRILNSYLNPQTISGGEMDWYGFAEGNPNSFEFAQKVQELKSIRDAFKKDFENLAEFERVVDYDITNISEVKASFEKQDANVVVITFANLKQPKEVGLYAQIRKFSRENNLKIIVQNINEVANLTEIEGNLEQRKASLIPTHQIREQAENDFRIKGTSDLIFSLVSSPNQNTLTQEEKRALIRYNNGKYVKELETLQGVESQYDDGLFLNQFGIDDYFIDAIKTNTTKEAIVKHVRNKYREIFIEALLDDEQDYSSYFDKKKNKITFKQEALLAYDTFLNIVFKNSEIRKELTQFYATKSLAIANMVDVFSKIENKIKMGLNDFSLNDYTFDGVQRIDVLPLVISSYDYLMKRFSPKLNPSRNENIGIVTKELQESITDVFKEKGVDFSEMVRGTEAYADFTQLIGRDKNILKEKIEKALKNRFKFVDDATSKNYNIAFFNDVENANKPFVNKKNNVRDTYLDLLQKGYSFGIEMGDYGVVFKDSDFRVNSTIKGEYVVNPQVHAGGLGVYFTYTVVRKSPNGNFEFLSNRVVIGDLYKKDGKIISKPMYIEFGASAYTLDALLNDGEIRAQSASVSFLENDTHKTNTYSHFEMVSEEKDGKVINGMYKLNFIVKPDALENLNILQFSDYWSGRKTIVDGEVSLTPAADPFSWKEAFGLSEKALSSMTDQEIMEHTAKSAALSLSEMSALKDTVFNQDDFSTSLNGTIIFNFDAMERAYRFILSSGVSEKQIKFRVEDIKKQVDSSNLSNGQDVIKLTSLMAYFVTDIQVDIDTYVENYNGGKFIYEEDIQTIEDIKKSRTVYIASRLIRDHYEVLRGNTKPLEESLSNSGKGSIMSNLGFFYDKIYNQMQEKTSTLKDGLNEAVAFLNTLTPRFNLTNEVKFARLKTNNFSVIQLQTFGDFEKTSKFQEIQAKAKQAGVALDIVKQNDLSGEYLAKQKESQGVLEDVIVLGSQQAQSMVEADTLYRGRTIKLAMDRRVKQQFINNVVLKDDNSFFSLESKAKSKKMTRESFAKLVKKVRDGNVETLSQKEETKEVFVTTQEQKEQEVSTRTNNSKLKFDTEFGKYEKKNAVYNSIISISKTIKNLLEYQKANEFQTNYPNFTQPISLAIEKLNGIKKKLESILGLKTSVSPYDANVLVDAVNPSILTQADLDLLQQDKQSIMDIVDKEGTPAGIIEAQNIKMSELIAKANDIASTSVNSINTVDGMAESVARPSLVVPTDAKKQSSFKLYLKLMKMLNFFNKYKTLSGFQFKPDTLKNTYDFTIAIENVVKELVKETNLPVTDVLNVFEPMVVGSENYITKGQMMALEEFALRMTSLESSQNFQVYLKAKEQQQDLYNKLLKDIKEEVKKEKETFLKEAEKQFEVKLEQKVSTIESVEQEIVRELDKPQALNRRELKYLWFLIASEKMTKLKEYAQSLKNGTEEKTQVLTILKRRAEQFKEEMSADKKVSQNERLIVKNIFSNANNSTIVNQIINDANIKSYKDFVKKYYKDFTKTQQAVSTQAKEVVEKIRVVEKQYITLQDLETSTGKTTPLGIISFSKPQKLITYTNKLGETNSKIVDKPGVQISIKSTKESLYFPSKTKAVNYLNNRINAHVVKVGLNNELKKQSEGLNTQEVKASSTQEVSSIPTIEQVVSLPTKQEVAQATPLIPVKQEVKQVKKENKNVWIPTEPITVKYGEFESTLMPETALQQIKDGEWTYQSEEEYVELERLVLQTTSENQEKVMEEARVKKLEEQQTLPTPVELLPPGVPGNVNGGNQGGSNKSQVVNIFADATKVSLGVNRINYKQNEERFSDIIEVVLNRVNTSKNANDITLKTLYQNLEDIVRKYRTENNIYNHISSTVAKIIIEEMDKILRATQPGGKIVRIPTPSELQNIVDKVNSAIFAALDYVDTDLRVKVNVSKFNPNGFLYTRGMFWYLRDMKAITNWDKATTDEFNFDTRGEAWRRLMNAIYNFNNKGFGMSELTGALKEFHLSTQVEPITDLSLNENEPRTVDTTVKQWLQNTQSNKEITRALNINVLANGLVNPLLDPFSVAEMAGLFDEKSWAMVLMDKIVRGQERVFEVYRDFDDIFSEEFLSKNNKNLIELEKRTAKITNLGGIDVRMSQVIYLRNMLLREIARNRAIDMKLIKGEKTNHFKDGFTVDLLAITEFKQKKQDKKVSAKILNALDLLNELDTVIKGDKFASMYNEMVMNFFAKTYNFVNERFKEIQGANLTNDGANIQEKLTISDKATVDKFFNGLPKTLSMTELANIYVPFLLDNSSYFKSQKLDFQDILNAGVFDGMVLELKDSTGIVSVESITNVVESYKQEVANYYGLHRIMRDLNLVVNYRLEMDGQTYYINRNIDKWTLGYFEKLLMDMAGYGSINYGSELIQKWLPIIRSNFYTAALGFNVKVVFTQFATFLNLWNLYGEGDFGFMGKMFGNLAAQASPTNKVIIEKMTKSNSFYWDRSKGGTFEIGEATREGMRERGIIDAIKQFSMAGITFTDNMINKAFYLTLLQSTNPKTGTLYTEAEANRTLTIGILRSQSSKLNLTKSSLLRDKNDITRIMLRFLGEPLKQITQIATASKQVEYIEKLEKNQNVIEQIQQEKVDKAQVKYDEAKKKYDIKVKLEESPDFATAEESVQELIRKEIEIAKNEEARADEELRRAKENQTRVRTQVKTAIQKKAEAKKSFGRRVASLITTINYLAILGFMFDMFRTGGGEKDKPRDEELWSHILKKLGGRYIDEMIGMFPILRDVVSVLKGYELNTIPELQSTNDIAAGIGSILRFFVEGDNINWNRTLYNLTMNISRLFGIPLQNLESTFRTPLLYISETSWYNYNNFIGKQDRDNIELAEAVRTGDTAMISAIVDRKISKREIKVAAPIKNEIKRLAKEGYEVNITGVPTKFTDENGRERNLTAKEKEDFIKAYNKADPVIQKLFRSGQYRRLNDKQKARLIQAVYAYYYKLAKQDVLGIDGLSEEMTFRNLNEAYNYFLKRATSYFKTQSRDDDQPTIIS